VVGFYAGCGEEWELMDFGEVGVRWDEMRIWVSGVD